MTRILFLLFFIPVISFAQIHTKQHVIVLTDIEADPDDSQSLIRFLLYSNQWNIEGLIATTSIHQKNRVAPETILNILAAYKKVQPNLLKHEPGYPSYEELRGRVKKGLPVYGMEGVGKGKDSEKQVMPPYGFLFGEGLIHWRKHSGKSNKPNQKMKQGGYTGN
jgi:hypothetical protein